MGWASVAVIVVAELVFAVLAMGLLRPRWWDYVVVGCLTAALIVPAERSLTGDMSRYLPDAIWSDGADGKDQIIYVSAASTVLLPLIATVLILYALKWIWGNLAKRRPG